MADIYHFNNPSQDEPESCCEYCDIAKEYMEYLVQTDDPQQFFDILREALEEARKVGIKEFLVQQIDAQEELLAELMYGDCDGEDN